MRPGSWLDNLLTIAAVIMPAAHVPQGRHTNCFVGALLVAYDVKRNDMHHTGTIAMG